MPGTFSQIYIQIVFAVKGRESLIHNSWEEELYKYISGIIRNKDQKMLELIDFYNSDILKKIGEINWNSTNINLIEVDESYPFKDIIDAISIIKYDVNFLIKERKKKNKSTKKSL